MNAIIKNLTALYNYGCEHRPYAILNDYLEYILVNESSIPEAIQEVIPVILTYTDLHEMFPESNHIQLDYNKLESKLIQTIEYYTNQKLKPAINYNNIEYNHYILLKLKSEYNIKHNVPEAAPQGADRTLTNQLSPDDNKPMPEAAGTANTGNLNIGGHREQDTEQSASESAETCKQSDQAMRNVNPEAAPQGADREQSQPQPASTHPDNPAKSPATEPASQHHYHHYHQPEQNPEAAGTAQSEGWEGSFAGRTLPSESQESRAGAGKSLSLAPILPDNILIKPDDFPTAIRFMLK